MAEVLPGVHVVQAAQGSAGPGGAVNICLLIEGGETTMVDAGLPGSSAPRVSRPCASRCECGRGP